MDFRLPQPFLILLVAQLGCMLVIDSVSRLAKLFMKKILILLAAVVVVAAAVGGYWLWVKYQRPKLSEDDASSYSQDEHRALDNGADYRISATTSALPGTWRSLEDIKFERQFKSDGTVVDSYGGDPEANTKGSWSVFTKENPDRDFTGQFEDGAVYLKMTADDDKLYFKLVKVTPEELEMVYLDRGNTLRFTKQ